MVGRRVGRTVGNECCSASVSKMEEKIKIREQIRYVCVREWDTEGDG